MRVNGAQYKVVLIHSLQLASAKFIIHSLKAVCIRAHGVWFIMASQKTISQSTRIINLPTYPTFKIKH